MIHCDLASSTPSAEVMVGSAMLTTTPSMTDISTPTRTIASTR
jgi:hypothetical protein